MSNLTKEQERRLKRLAQAVEKSGSDRLKTLPLEEIAKIKTVRLSEQVKAIERTKQIQKIIKIFKLLLTIFALVIILRVIIFFIFHK